MKDYDLCLAWNWEYDADFAALLDRACATHRLELLQVTGENLDSVIEALDRRDIRFDSFLDRASDSETRFLDLADRAKAVGAHRFNPRERAVRAMNKATMHLEFLTAGIRTPYTIILSPHEDQPHLPPLDLQPLGDRFTIKPAHGGGGGGVIIEARTFDQVREARLEYPSDHYLLQAHVVPAELGGRPAWFRVIYCSGVIFPFWWHVVTHTYDSVIDEEVREYRLEPLFSTAETIAAVCGLDLFSTEIARTEDGLFVAVDYVNDPIDLRLRSKTADGVPDDVVERIADRLASAVLEHRRVTAS